MRAVDVSEITENIKEMCIEANHFLSEDMKCAMRTAADREASALGRQILGAKALSTVPRVGEPPTI